MLLLSVHSCTTTKVLLMLMFVASNYIFCESMDIKQNSKLTLKKTRKHFKTKVNLKHEPSKNKSCFNFDRPNVKIPSMNNEQNLATNHFHPQKKKRHLSHNIKVLFLKTTEQSTCTPFFIHPQPRKKKMRFYQYMPVTYQPVNTLESPNVTEVSMHTKKGKAKKLFGKTNHSTSPHTLLTTEEGILKSDTTQIYPNTQYSEVSIDRLTGPNLNATNSFLHKLFNHRKTNAATSVTSSLANVSSKTLLSTGISEESMSGVSTNHLNRKDENASSSTEFYSEDSTREFQPYTQLRMKDFFNFNNPLKSSTMSRKMYQKISTTYKNEDLVGGFRSFAEDKMSTGLLDSKNDDNIHQTSKSSQDICSEQPIKLQPETYIKSLTVQMTKPGKMSDFCETFQSESTTPKMEKTNLTSNLNCTLKNNPIEENYNVSVFSNATFVKSSTLKKISQFRFPILKLFSSKPPMLSDPPSSPNLTEETERSQSFSGEELDQTTRYFGEEESTDQLNTTSKLSRFNFKRIFKSNKSTIAKTEDKLSVLKNSSLTDSLPYPVVGTHKFDATQIPEHYSRANELTSQESNFKNSKTITSLSNKSRNHQGGTFTESVYLSLIASDCVTNNYTFDQKENYYQTTKMAKTPSDTSIGVGHKGSKLKNVFSFKKITENTVSSTPQGFDPGGSYLSSVGNNELLTSEELFDETSECGLNVCNSLSPEEMQELLFLHTKNVNDFKSTTARSWFVRNFSKNQKNPVKSVDKTVHYTNLFKWFPKQTATRKYNNNIQDVNISEFTTTANLNYITSKIVLKPISTDNMEESDTQNIYISDLTTVSELNIINSKKNNNAALTSKPGKIMAFKPFKTSKNVSNLIKNNNKKSKLLTLVPSKLEETLDYEQSSQLSKHNHYLTTPPNFLPDKNRVFPTKQSRSNLDNKITSDHDTFFSKPAPVRPFRFTRNRLNSFAGSESPRRIKEQMKPISTLRLNKSTSNVDFNPKHFGLLLHNLTRDTNSTLLVNPLEVYQMDSNKTIPKLNLSKEKQMEVINNTGSLNDSSIWAYVMKPLESLVNVFTGYSPHNITKVGDINASTIGNGSLPSHLQPANSSLIILTVNSSINDVKETRIGLWDFVGGFFHCLVETFAEPKLEDIHFYLYTRNNLLQPEELNMTEELFPTSTSDANYTDDYLPDPVLEFGSTEKAAKNKRNYIDEEDDYEGFEPIKAAESGLESKWFNILRETKILVHGYRQNYQTDIVANMKDAYLNKSDVNVIVLDWSFVGDNPCYVIVAHHGLRCVGRLLARFLDQLVEGGVSLSRVHLVGFSLGAHVAGHAGAETKHGLVSRITGLDPALPLIPMEAGVSLDVGDATFVDIIHSAAGYLGQPGPMGHADFYPNGGAQQPGCDLASLGGCSHRRSAFYFIESITSDIGFQATLCDSWQNYQAGLCLSSSPLPMGEPCPSNASGKYFLLTALKEPFALVPEEHTKVKKSLLIDILNDIIYDL